MTIELYAARIYREKMGDIHAATVNKKAVMEHITCMEGTISTYVEKKAGQRASGTAERNECPKPEV